MIFVGVILGEFFQRPFFGPFGGSSEYTERLNGSILCSRGPCFFFDGLSNHQILRKNLSHENSGYFSSPGQLGC